MLLASTDHVTFHYVDEHEDQAPSFRCNGTKVLHDLMFTMRASHREVAAMINSGVIRICHHCIKVDLARGRK